MIQPGIVSRVKITSPAAVRLFRRQCFQEIGGYIPNRAGGIDWIAVTTARMKGWKTRSFPEKRFHHYRSLGTAERNKIKASFSYGEKDYYLGNSPIWELFRVSYRMAKPPFVIEGLALFCGFCWAAIRGTKRPGIAGIDALSPRRADEKIEEHHSVPLCG